MSDVKLETIRSMCATLDTGYSQSSKQFTSMSGDRAALKYLLEKYDDLQEEVKSVKKHYTKLWDDAQIHMDKTTSMYSETIKELEEKLRVAVEALAAICSMTNEPVTRQFADDRLTKLKGGKDE